MELKNKINSSPEGKYMNLNLFTDKLDTGVNFCYANFTWQSVHVTSFNLFIFFL